MPQPNPQFTEYIQKVYNRLGGSDLPYSFDEFQTRLKNSEGFRNQIYADLGGSRVIPDQDKFNYVVSQGAIRPGAALQPSGVKKKDGFQVEQIIPTQTPTGFSDVQFLGGAYRSVAPEVSPNRYEESLSALKQVNARTEQFEKEVTQLGEQYKARESQVKEYLDKGLQDGSVQIESGKYVFSDQNKLDEFNRLADSLNELGGRINASSGEYKALTESDVARAAGEFQYQFANLDHRRIKMAPKDYGWLDRFSLTYEGLKEGTVDMLLGATSLATDAMFTVYNAVGSKVVGPAEAPAFVAASDKQRQEVREIALSAVEGSFYNPWSPRPMESPYYAERLQHMQDGFWGKAYYGAVRSIPAMLTPYMSGIFLQTYEQIEKDLAPLEISEDEKLLYKTSYGLASAVLERYGFRNLMKGTSITNRVLTEAFKRMPKNATVQTMEEVINQTAKTWGAKYVSAAAAGSLAEFETGFLQSGTEIAVKSLAQWSTTAQGAEGSVENLPTGWKEIGAYMLEQGQLEMAGALFIGQGAYISQATMENRLGQNIEDADFMGMEQLMRNPKGFDAIVQVWEKLALNGTVTREEAEKVISGLLKAQEVIKMMPKLQLGKYVNLESRRKVYDLLSEKLELNNQLKEVDEATAEPINKRIGEINAEIRSEIAAMEQQVAEFGQALPETQSGELAPVYTAEQLKGVTVKELMTRLYKGTNLGSTVKVGLMLNAAKMFSELGGANLRVIVGPGQDFRHIAGRAMTYDKANHVIYINPDAYVDNVYAHEFSHPFIEYLFEQDKEKFNLVYEAVKMTAMRRSPIEDLVNRGLLDPNNKEQMEKAEQIKTYDDWAQYVQWRTGVEDAPVEAVVELMADVFNRTYNRTPYTLQLQDGLRDIFNAIGLYKVAEQFNRKDISLSEAMSRIEAADIFGSETLPIVKQALERNVTEDEEQPVPSGEQVGQEAEQAPVQEASPEAPATGGVVQAPTEEVAPAPPAPPAPKSKTKEPAPKEEAPVEEAPKPKTEYYAETKKTGTRVIRRTSDGELIGTVSKAKDARGWVVKDAEGNIVGKKRLSVNAALEEAKAVLKIKGEISKTAPKKTTAAAPTVTEEVTPVKEETKKPTKTKKEPAPKEPSLNGEKVLMEFNVKIEGKTRKVTVYEGRTENGVKYGDFFMLEGEQFMIPDKVEKGYKVPTADWFTKRAVPGIVKKKLDTIAAAKSRKTKAEVVATMKKGGIAPTISEVAEQDTREKRATTEEIVVKKDGEDHRKYRPQTLQVGFKNKNGEWVYETKRTKAQFEKDYLRNFPKEEQDSVLEQLRAKFDKVTSTKEETKKPTVEVENKGVISQGEKAIVYVVNIKKNGQQGNVVASIDANRLVISRKKPRSRYMQETQYESQEDFNKAVDELQKQIKAGELAIADAQVRKYGAGALNLSQAMQTLMDEETDLLLREAKKRQEQQKLRDEAAKQRKKEQTAAKVEPANTPQSIVSEVSKRSMQAALERLPENVRAEMLDMMIDASEGMADDVRGTMAMRAIIEYVEKKLNKKYGTTVNEKGETKNVPVAQQYKNAVADIFNFEAVKAESEAAVAKEKAEAQPAQEEKVDKRKQKSEALKRARQYEYDKLRTAGVEHKEALKRARQIKMSDVVGEGTIEAGAEGVSATSSFFKNLGYAPAPVGDTRAQVLTEKPRISDIYIMLTMAQTAIAPMTPKQLGLLNTLELQSKEEIRARFARRYSAFSPREILNIVENSIYSGGYNIERAERDKPYRINFKPNSALAQAVNNTIINSAISSVVYNLSQDAPLSVIDGEAIIKDISLNREFYMSQLESMFIDNNYTQEEANKIINEELETIGAEALFAINAYIAAVKESMSDVISSAIVSYNDFVGESAFLDGSKNKFTRDFIEFLENELRFEYDGLNDDYTPLTDAVQALHVWVQHPSAHRVLIQPKQYTEEEINEQQTLMQFVHVLTNNSSRLEQLIGAPEEQISIVPEDDETVINEKLGEILDNKENKSQKEVERAVSEHIISGKMGEFFFYLANQFKQGFTYKATLSDYLNGVIGEYSTTQKTKLKAPKVGQKINSIRQLAEVFSFYRSNRHDTHSFVFVKDGMIVDYLTTASVIPNAIGYANTQAFQEAFKKSGADGYYVVLTNKQGLPYGERYKDVHQYIGSQNKEAFYGTLILDGDVFGYMPYGYAQGKQQIVFANYNAQQTQAFPRINEILQTGVIESVEQDTEKAPISLPYSLVNQLHEASRGELYPVVIFLGGNEVTGFTLKNIEFMNNTVNMRSFIREGKTRNGATAAVLMVHQEAFRLTEFPEGRAMYESLIAGKDNMATNADYVIVATDDSNYISYRPESFSVTTNAVGPKQAGIDYLFKEVDKSLTNGEDVDLTNKYWGDAQPTTDFDAFEIEYDGKTHNLYEFAQAYQESLFDEFGVDMFMGFMNKGSFMETVSVDPRALSTQHFDSPVKAIRSVVEETNHILMKALPKMEASLKNNIIAFGKLAIDEATQNVNFKPENIRYSAYNPTNFDKIFDKMQSTQKGKIEEFKKSPLRAGKEAILDKRISIINFINQNINQGNATQGALVEAHLRADHGKVINASRRADHEVLKAFGVSDYTAITNERLDRVERLLQAKTIIEINKRRLSKLARQYASKAKALGNSSLSELVTDKQAAINEYNSLRQKVAKTEKEIQRAVQNGDTQRAAQLRFDLLSYKDQLDDATTKRQELSYRIAVVKGTTKDIKVLEDEILNPGGITVQDAEDMIASRQKENPEEHAKDEAVVGRIFELSRKILDEKLAEGMISQATYDALKDYGYSPRIVLQRLIDGETMSQMRALSQSPKSIKRLQGGTESAMVTDPMSLIQYIVVTHMRAVETNKLNNSLYNFVETLGDNKVISIEQPLLDKKTGKPRVDKYGRFVYSQKVQEGSTVIEVLRDGQVYRMRVNLDFYTTWAGVSGLAGNQALLTALGFIAGGKIVKAGATIANPSFAIVNIIRDVAFVLSSTDTFSKYSTFAGLVKAAPYLGRGLVSAALSKKGTRGEVFGIRTYAEVYEKALQGGFAMDFVAEGALSIDQIYRRLEIAERIKMKGTSTAKTFDKISRHLMAGVMFLQETTEVATRLAIFERQMEVLSKKYSAELASGKMTQDDILTMAAHASRKHLDYAITGTASSAIEAFRPYSNAMIRAVEQALYYTSPFTADKVFGTRVLTKEEKSLFNVFAVTKAAEFAIGYALIMFFNNAIGTPEEPEDEKGAKRIHDLDYFSDDLKDRNMIILTGEREKKLANGDYDPDSPPVAWIIPITQEQQPVIRMSQAIFANMMPEFSDRHTDNVLHALKTGAENFLPYLGQGVSSAIESGDVGDVTQNLLGQIPLMGAYIAGNYNKDTYTDSYVINPYDFESAAPKNKYDDRTHATFVRIGQATDKSPKNMQAAFEKYATKIENNYFLRLIFSVSDNLTYNGLIENGILPSRMMEPESVKEAATLGLIRRLKRAGNANWKSVQRYDKLKLTEARDQEIHEVRNNVRALAREASQTLDPALSQQYASQALQIITDALDVNDALDRKTIEDIAQMYFDEIEQAAYLSRDAMQIARTRDADEKAELILVMIQEDKDAALEALYQIQLYEARTGEKVITDRTVDWYIRFAQQQ